MVEESTSQKETHYVVSGNGEALIFIHGVGLDHTMWKKQIQFFAHHFRVYAYDMIGHGLSKKPEKDTYDISDYVDQLHTFLVEHEIQQAHIVGFSMGGMVGQAFCLAFPNMVKTLSIVSAVANRSEKERKAVLERVKMVEKNGVESTIDGAIQRWFSEGFISQEAQIIQNIRQCLKNNEEKIYLKSYKVFASADQQLWGRLENISVPTFIITGEKDIGSNPRMAKDMKSKITNAKMVVVPGMQHMLPVEGAEIFNEHLHHFLQNLEQGGDTH